MMPSRGVTGKTMRAFLDAGGRGYAVAPPLAAGNVFFQPPIAMTRTLTTSTMVPFSCPAATFSASWVASASAAFRASTASALAARTTTTSDLVGSHARGYVTGRWKKGDDELGNGSEARWHEWKGYGGRSLEDSGKSRRIFRRGDWRGDDDDDDDDDDGGRQKGSHSMGEVAREGGPKIQLQDAIIFAKDINKLLNLVGRDGDLMLRHFTYENISTAISRLAVNVRRAPDIYTRRHKMEELMSDERYVRLLQMMQEQLEEFSPQALAASLRCLARMQDHQDWGFSVRTTPDDDVFRAKLDAAVRRTAEDMTAKQMSMTLAGVRTLGLYGLKMSEEGFEAMAKTINSKRFVAKMDKLSASTVVRELGLMPRLAAKVSPGAWMRLMCKAAAEAKNMNGRQVLLTIYGFGCADIHRRRNATDGAADDGVSPPSVEESSSERSWKLMTEALASRVQKQLQAAMDASPSVFHSTSGSYHGLRYTRCFVWPESSELSMSDEPRARIDVLAHGCERLGLQISSRWLAGIPAAISAESERIAERQKEGTLLPQIRSTARHKAKYAAKAEPLKINLKYVWMKGPALKQAAAEGDHEAAEELERRSRIELATHANLVASADRGEPWAIQKLHKQQNLLDRTLVHHADKDEEWAKRKLELHEVLRVAGDLYPAFKANDPVMRKSGVIVDDTHAGDDSPSASSAAAAAGEAAEAAAKFPELRERFLSTSTYMKPVDTLMTAAEAGDEQALKEINERRGLAFQEYDNCVLAADRGEEWAIYKLHKQHRHTYKQAIESTYNFPRGKRATRTAGPTGTTRELADLHTSSSSTAEGDVGH